MDWMTLALEAVGIAILCVWIVVPIKEFREILTVIRHREATSAEPRGGSEVERGEGPQA